MNLNKTFVAVQDASRNMLALSDKEINQILLAVMSFDDLYILWQLRSFGGDSYITDKSEGLNLHVW